MIRSIGIVGAGVAGWMAALALRRALPGAGISVVETEGPDWSLGPFGPGETSLPGFEAWLADHGIDEGALLRSARGSFSLGTAFSGWAGQEADWFLPFGTIGAPIGTVAFHQLAARMRESGQALRLADFSLAAIAAASGRFARPSPDPRSVLSSYGYGLHLDRAGLAEALRLASGLQPAGGFRAFEDDIVTLQDGTCLTADLWLDCSGPAALLAGDHGWESWAEWLPVDRAVETWNAVEGVPPPYAHAGAFEAGWQRTVPLIGGQGGALLYASAFLPDQPGAIPFVQGRRTRAWIGNVVALGAAATLIEPLHGYNLALLQNAIARLIGLLPAAPGGPEPAEYNRLAASEADRVRDFAILHYKTNGRTGEPLWDQARAAPVPETLAHKLDLYASRGRLPVYDEELFEQEEWIAVLDGQGIRPRRHDALADAIPEPQLRALAARIREVIVDAVRRMPHHGATLREEGLLP
ncbi:tryptophan halogenase [Sphingomonas kyeonggiensis]|uniref:tryptophan halogenase family protein n=1 Tax=Sphingomonas kyeonggiensis TaxID=1268553 RepID=UPI00278073F4|nr:tryptophan halogenase family protein [Sphingomonas kyeonggiensis]MDQ0252060.1 tryptophan halogenase [Sphingomonas kyeonggiensis]